MIRRAGRPGGFTLIEVMVALAVVALALPALLFALSQQADATGYLRDKSMAHAVAANKLAELRLFSYAQRNVMQGDDSGVTQMAQRDWYWWVNSKLTNVRLFYRVEIKVADSEDGRDRPLYTLVGFLPADLQADDPNAP